MIGKTGNKQASTPIKNTIHYIQRTTATQVYLVPFPMVSSSDGGISSSGSNALRSPDPFDAVIKIKAINYSAIQGFTSFH